MTQCIYIASPVKLPKGNVERSSMIEKYTTNEMSSYLFFENNYNDLLKRKESLSIHFSYDYQVCAETNALPLRFQEKGTIEEKICLDILYQYLNHALQESGVLEMFTCLSGEENLEIAIKKQLKWDDIKDPYDLILLDREFLTITL